MARRLTELTLARVTPPKTGRLELADSQLPGLSCRVTADGTRTFALRYRVEGRQRRLTIGRYPIVGLAEARWRAREALAQVERGVDPAAAKVEERAERDRNSVAAVVAAYVEKRLKPRTRTWADVDGMLKRDVVRAWGARPIASITRRDLRDLIENIASRGSPVVANRILRYLRGLFAWAIRNDYAASNPATDIDRPHDERPRQRALSESEIKAVWQAFDQMAYPFGVLGQLLLLTGQRRGEWAGASWSEIDLDRQVWNLPGARSKTGAEHMLPLVPEVVEIVGSIPRIEGSDLIFPSSRLTSDRPISGFSKGLATAHRLSGTAGWTWHDLRRTARTGFARLGVTAAIGERILSHADGTRSAITVIYDVHSYQPEMRRALELWAAEIERIVTGEPAKVVPLRPFAKSN